MKKVVLLAVAVMVTVAAHSQIVVGLQGGWYQQSINNPNYRTDKPWLGSNTQYDAKVTALVGGLQLGYQITPKLYVGVTGQYLSNTDYSNLLRDSIHIDIRSHSSFEGMTMPVDNHEFTNSRSGWNAGVQVKYEVVRYGNMHFNMMLQASYGTMGYTTTVERFTKSAAFVSPVADERGERMDFDAVFDGITNTIIDISLRPTLAYDFSTHLSAELSLDFLSLGYVSDTRHVDSEEFMQDPTNPAIIGMIPSHDETTTTIYAGLNTLMQTLAWESPILRLGFNWKF